MIRPVHSELRVDRLSTKTQFVHYKFQEELDSFPHHCLSVIPRVGRRNKLFVDPSVITRHLPDTSHILFVFSMYKLFLLVRIL